MNDIVIPEITISNLELFAVFLTFFLLLVAILAVNNHWENIRPHVTEPNVFFWSALGISLLLFVPAIGQLINIVWDPRASGLLQDDKRGYAVLLVAIISAPLVVWRTAVAHMQGNTAAQGLITDRITKAVEQLGAEKTVWEDNKQCSKPNLEVRLGGIYALERIAQDSERDHISVMEILCAYVRENSPAKIAVKPPEGVNFDSRARTLWTDSIEPVGIDIQAAIDVIARRKETQIEIELAALHRLDLRNCNLQTVDFKRGNFDRALMTSSHMELAHMSSIKLNGAFLYSAKLSWAWLNWAQLSGANFTDVDARRTAVNSTDLSDLLGLTEVQIHLMFGDGATKLPKGVKRPAQWTAEKFEFTGFFEQWTNANQ